MCWVRGKSLFDLRNFLPVSCGRKEELEGVSTAIPSMDREASLRKPFSLRVRKGEFEYQLRTFM